VVEKLDSKVQDGDELKGVRAAPPIPPFTAPLSLFQFCISKVSDDASGVGLTCPWATKKFVGQT
jgi:hypothetical protein